MRTVQSLRDAEVILGRLLDETERLKKDVFALDATQRKFKPFSAESLEGKFYDIANEVEFMRELNLVIHKLHHKFKRIIFEGESRWYDFDGRMPSQWFTQFAIIPDNNNKALFLRDESNNPIWEITRKVGGTNVSRWMIYADLIPPSTNPVTPSGYFKIGYPGFRWDEIYCRKLDADYPAGVAPQVTVRGSGTNPISLYSYSATNCSLIMGADVTGNTFTARSVNAFLILKDDDLLIFGNKNLTPGTTFAPTLLWRFTDIDILPSGDKNIGSASFRVATYFGKYMELSNPDVENNTQFRVNTGGLNDLSLTSYDSNACAVGFGVMFTGGNWIARANGAVILLKTSNELWLYQNSGLGVGGAYSPTNTWKWDSFGHFYPASGQNVGNASFRVGTVYASSLNLSGTFSTSGAINATGYQINGVTVIDSGRQFSGTNIGLTGPGNFAAQGYVQSDGGFRFSGALGQSTTINYTKVGGASGQLIFNGGILTSFS